MGIQSRRGIAGRCAEDRTKALQSGSLRTVIRTQDISIYSYKRSSLHFILSAALHMFFAGGGRPDKGNPPVRDECYSRYALLCISHSSAWAACTGQLCFTVDPGASVGSKRKPRAVDLRGAICRAQAWAFVDAPLSTVVQSTAERRREATGSHLLLVSDSIASVWPFSVPSQSSPLDESP